MGTPTEKTACKKCINHRLSFIPLVFIKGYRYFISPLIGSRCRFYPSCSAYAEEAYQRFGWIKGSCLSIKRLLKCHPWHEGGIDLVPEQEIVTEKTDPTPHN